jgi:uncharacterized protein (DUF697 family)
MDDNLSQWLLIAFALLCVLPLIIFGVMAFIVYRAGQQRLETWLGPDVAKMQAEYEALRTRYPRLSEDALLAHIIQGQAVKAGIVGALTSVGGLITLPIALPIDIVLSFRIQAALISFIAHLYGGSDSETRSASVRSYLVMTGSSRVTQSTTRFLMSWALRIIGKSFSKLIPIVGALIGFGVNYAIVQVMGRAAARWYTAQRNRSAGRGLAASEVS